jgi:hypothetical protein
MSKKIDIAILILLTFAVSAISLFFKLNFINSTLLMFGVPAVYLSFRNQRSIKKVSIFSFLISIPFTFVVDYMITKDNGWHIVSSLFSYRIFSIIALEQFVWGFAFTFYAISFYEYFLDKKVKKDPLITHKMRLFSLALFTLLGIFIYLAANYAEFILLPYAYTIMATMLGIIPLVSFLLHHPKLTKRFLKATLYFTLVTTINEFIGLSLNHWIFPGNNFIGKINLFNFVIPYEEIIFYMILLTPMLFTYYEFLDDDSK